MEKKITFSEIWKEAKTLFKKNYLKVVPFMLFIILMSMVSVIPVSFFGGSILVKNAFDVILSLILGPILSLSTVYAMMKGTSVKESLTHILKNWKGAFKTTYLVAGIIYSFIVILLSVAALAVISSALGVLGTLITVLVGIAAFVFMIIMSFRYAFAIYLWVDKKIEGFKALAASRELTKGKMGKVIGYLLLLYLILASIILLSSFAAAALAVIAGGRILAAVLVGLIFLGFVLFVAPFAVAFMVSLYKGILSLSETDLSEAKIKPLEKIAAVFGLIVFIIIMGVSIFIPDNNQERQEPVNPGATSSVLEGDFSQTDESLNLGGGQN